jgi:FkbM family methyltransferase
MSKARYLLWRATRAGRTLSVRLKGADHLLLRPPPSDDLAIAYEIFVSRAYECPQLFDPAAVRLVVDVGANVGYTCVYWLRQFPSARVIAFEPHPGHLAQIRRHLAMNGYAGRVTLHGAAAGMRDGELFLTDDGCRSTLVAGAGRARIPVPVVDWISLVGTDDIDLLKIDIEGGEYALLADPRFATLPVRILVLEWHRTPDYPDGHRWCVARLAEAGFRILSVEVDAGVNGLIWAVKDVRGARPSEERRSREMEETQAAAGSRGVVEKYV